MNFVSAEFVLFLLITLIVYGFAPKKWRWGVLLLASYVFYGIWNWKYIWVLAAITLGTYYVSRLIARTEEPRKKSWLLVLGLAIVLGFLGAFKYYDYLIHSVAYYTHVELPFPLIKKVAPIGIAFFSLQVFAYLVDVYRGHQDPPDNLGHYALFVSFFPQLVAGPITRAQKLLPQINFLLPVLPEELQAGFHRLLMGMFQKFVVADRLANFTTPIFDDHLSYNSFVLLANLYLYAFQIYSDFAGYSNIAIGIAKLFGVNLAENFNQPYLALDVADFWNRWHISLSNWLRDYIFYPSMRFLRKRTENRRAWWLIWVPPLVTMFVSGVWHGTGPKFILWGLLHGVMLALAASTARWRKGVIERMGKAGWVFKFVEWFVTFNFLVFSWTFFRMPGIVSGLSYLKHIVYFSKTGSAIEMQLIGVTVIVLVVFLLVETLMAFNLTLERLEKAPLAVRWAVYYLVIFLIMFMGNFVGSQPFIYEQF